MDLDDWRSRINDLDEQILSLLNQRGHAALQIGDFACVMDGGRLVFEGTPAQLAQNETLKDVYLGLGEGTRYSEVARNAGRVRRG